MSEMPTIAVPVQDPETHEKRLEYFKKLANYLQDNKALPATFNNPWQLIMALQAGRDYGMTPTEAMQCFAMINGRISMYGMKIIERLRKGGYDLELDESFEWEEYEKDKKKYKRPVGYCKAKIIRVEDPTDFRIEEYTTQDAKDADLLGKDNRTKYPKLMLRYRAIGNGIKFFCPEVLGGVPMYEELKDHYDKPSTFERITWGDLTDDDIIDGFAAPDEEVATQESSTEKAVISNPPPLQMKQKTIEEPKDPYIVGAQVKHKLLWVWVIEDMFAEVILVSFDGKSRKKLKKNEVEVLPTNPEQVDEQQELFRSE